MSCEVWVRPARAADAAELTRRAALVRRGAGAGAWDAFLYFFFQELTLEVCVLVGAVLFIFCGVSAGALLLLPLAAALLVAAAVAAAQHAHAHKHSQSVRGELFGLVAEARGALLPAPGAAVPVRLQPGDHRHAGYSHVVGTVSVSEFWGPQRRGWLHALAVQPDWECRGSYERPLLGAALTLPLLRLSADLPLA